MKKGIILPLWYVFFSLPALQKSHPVFTGHQVRAPPRGNKSRRPVANWNSAQAEQNTRKGRSRTTSCSWGWGRAHPLDDATQEELLLKADPAGVKLLMRGLMLECRGRDGGCLAVA